MEHTNELLIQPLPDCGEPKIYDKIMVNYLEKNGYNYEERIDTSMLDNLDQDYFRPPPKFDGSQVAVVDPKALELDNSYYSPDSSPVSSSDFSHNQHQRNHSSSTSTTDHTQATRGEPSRDLPLGGKESENTFMNSTFDFESASSTPVELSDAHQLLETPPDSNSKGLLLPPGRNVDWKLNGNAQVRSQEKEVRLSQIFCSHHRVFSTFCGALRLICP